MIREQRQFGRVPESFQAKCRPAGELSIPWKTIETINISAGGMRFLCEDLFDPSNELELQVKLPIGGEVFTINCTVIWSKSSAAGVAETGVAFNALEPEQQFQIDQLVEFLKKSPRPGGSA